MQKTAEFHTLFSRSLHSSTQKGAPGHYAPQNLALTTERGFTAQEDAQMKKEPGLKPSESPHLPLETPEQQPTCWKFALLLSPNPNAKPDHRCKPRQMMGSQKGCKQWPAQNNARTKSS